MSKKSESAEQHIKSVKRRTRRKYSAEEKIRIVLEGMCGDHSIAELCRREGMAFDLAKLAESRRSFSDLDYWECRKRQF